MTIVHEREIATALTCAAVIGVVTLSGCGAPPQSGISQSEWNANLVTEKDAAVRENMRTVQWAAEHYAADHGGSTYPVAIDDKFKTYFPGGVDGQRSAPVGPANPFTGVNHFPVLGTLNNVSAVRFGGRFDVEPGQIEYSPLGNGKAYAIIGGAHDGKVLMDQFHPKQILVLSNLSG